MNKQEGLNLLDGLATGINKIDPVVSTIFSDFDGTGAAANEIEALLPFIDYYTKTGDVINHRGYTLEMIIKLFTGLRRRVNEADRIYLRRMLALTERKGDTVFGNGMDLEHVFEMYISGVKAYIAENTNAENLNLIVDGDFEEDKWIVNAAYAYEARFSKRRGLFLDGDGKYCRQTLESGFEGGWYTFHFMLKGTCALRIRDGDGRCWNANEQIFLGDVILRWVDDCQNRYTTEDWKDICVVIRVAKNARLVFEFLSVEGEAGYVDHVRFFIKPPHPSYTLIFQYEGYAVNSQSLHMSVTGHDPAAGTRYEKESYLDHAFIVGRLGAYRKEYYQSLMDIVRPRGIQAFSEFVEKIIMEDQEEARG
jgi:hypothetical protein